MLIEATQLLDRPVQTAQGKTLGRVDRLVFHYPPSALAGFQVRQSGILKRLSGLEGSDVLSIHREAVVVDSAQNLKADLTALDEALKTFGRVLGVAAKTESGKSLGKVIDVAVEAETGLITRFYLKQLLTERIIPQQYVISLTPRQIIFKDVVDTPIFNQVASAAAAL